MQFGLLSDWKFSSGVWGILKAGIAWSVSISIVAVCELRNSFCRVFFRSLKRWFNVFIVCRREECFKFLLTRSIYSIIFTLFFSIISRCVSSYLAKSSAFFCAASLRDCSARRASCTSFSSCLFLSCRSFDSVCSMRNSFFSNSSLCEISAFRSKAVNFSSRSISNFVCVSLRRSLLSVFCVRSFWAICSAFLTYSSNLSSAVTSRILRSFVSAASVSYI